MLAVTHTMGRVERVLAFTSTIALVAVLAVVGPFSSQASAATFQVDTAEEFVDAVANINGMDGNHVIQVMGDLDFTDVSTVVLTFNGGVDPKNVTIESDNTANGGGYRISCDSGEGDCEPWLDSQIGPNGSLTIRGVLVSGFTDGVIVNQGTPLTIQDSRFENNANLGDTGPGSPVHGGVVSDYWSFNNYVINVHDSAFVNNLVTGGNSYGGALSVSHELHISNSLFEDNSSYGVAGDGAGGAISAYDVYVTIYNSQFIGNDALASPDSQFGRGGAIWGYQADIEIEDSYFENNTASGGGGAIHSNVNSYVGLYDSTFVANYASSEGGAVAILGTGGLNSAYVSGGTFIGNSSNFRGGAVYVYNTYFEVWESHFEANVASSAGGAIVVDESEAGIWRSLLVGNEASVGGALSGINDSLIAVDSSTLTENEAFGGSALWMSFSEAAFTHATIAGNQSTNQGPMQGIPGGQIGAQYAEVSMTNTVIVEPTNGGANCGYFSMTLNTGGHNFSDDASCGLTDLSDIAEEGADAQLGPLQFNGGDTFTMVPDQGSPLVDAIGDEGCVMETDDQRTVMRAQGDACDIGAVETLAPIYRDVVTPGGTVSFRILNAVEGEGLPELEAIPLNTLTPAAPASVAFPYGAQGLRIATWREGWPVDVDVYTPAPTTQFWKLLDGTWQQYPATLHGSTWSFRLIDGADGDSDGEENSVIVDPIALGAAAEFTG